MTVKKYVESVENASLVNRPSLSKLRQGYETSLDNPERGKLAAYAEAAYHTRSAAGFLEMDIVPESEMRFLHESGLLAGPRAVFLTDETIAELVAKSLGAKITRDGLGTYMTTPEDMNAVVDYYRKQWLPEHGKEYDK